MPAATDRPGVPFLFAVVLCAIGMSPDPGAAAAPYLCGTRLIERHAGELPLPDPPLQAAKPSFGADVEQYPAGIGVGTRQEFAVAGSPQLMPATCRYAGERVFVFVEDRQWDTNGGSILQSHVDGLVGLFERSTPADPGRGIHDLCTEAFGVVPDVDGYPQVFLLILDIPDSRLVGYFDARVAGHEVPELRKDILYVDEWFVRRQTYLARGTLAHEFQHLIHWGYDKDEETWLNEGMSGYAEALTGFPEADTTVVGAFLQRPGAGLTGWENQAWNYGSTYLFSAFLAERYGGDLIRAVVADTANGTDGIDAAFAGLGLNWDFEEAWSRWVTGNYAAEGDEFTYGALQGRRALWYPVSLPLESRRGRVEDQWGTIAILLRTPGSVEVEFAGEEGGRHRVWAWSMRAGGSELRELELDASNRGSAVATEIDSMALIIGRTSIEKGGFEVSARQVDPETAVEQPVAAASPVFRLGAAYPNPFNAAVRIPFSGWAEGLEISVYNAAGQRLRDLMPLSGSREIAWDGRDGGGRRAASGVYWIVAQPKSGTGGHGTSHVHRTAVTLIR